MKDVQRKLTGRHGQMSCCGFCSAEQRQGSPLVDYQACSWPHGEPDWHYASLTGLPPLSIIVFQRHTHAHKFSAHTWSGRTGRQYRQTELAASNWGVLFLYMSTEKKEALYDYTKLMLEGNREVIKNGKTEVQAEELFWGLSRMREEGKDSNWGRGGQIGKGGYLFQQQTFLIKLTEKRKREKRNNLNPILNLIPG